MKRGFTLIEMLVVIGIIMGLLGASIAGYSTMVRRAEDTRARELVSNVATALQALYVREGQWPKPLIAAAESDLCQLTPEAAYPLAAKGYLSLQTKNKRLSGYDRLGIVTPWAQQIIKERGSSVDLSTIVSYSKEGKATVQDHILRFAIDLDGDGITELQSAEGVSAGTKVRATACVWCCNKDGSLKANNRIQSWSKGQETEGL